MIGDSGGFAAVSVWQDFSKVLCLDIFRCILYNGVALYKAMQQSRKMTINNRRFQGGIFYETTSF
jgi:hypothetical protein